MRIVIGLALSLLATSASAEEKIKIAVVPTLLEDSAKGMVPSLFDDYLLTAVQNTTDASVIGQDDIGTMLGFEKQKEVMNCDDTACIADIGGALGVDKIVSVKIARLGEDWVATAKLINIKLTRVESRVNEIVSGDTKALLRAVPRLTGKLFGKPVTEADMEMPTSRPQASTPTVQRPSPATAATTAPNPSLGRGKRVLGTVLLLTGGGLAIVGGLWATNISECSNELDPFTGIEETCLNGLWYTYASLLVITGEILAGVGAKVHATGVARSQTGDPEVSGRPAAYWLGWLLAGFTMVTPLLTVSNTFDLEQGKLVGWATGLGSLAVFLLGSFAGSSPSGSAALPPPQPTIGLARDGRGHLVTTLGLGVGF